MTISSSSIKAVFFDIGGVVIRSPLIAIHAYEQEKGLPKDWLNLHIAKLGRGGAWQRFERNELELYPFYKEFGEELSDATRGNTYYREWCKSKNVEVPHLPESVAIDGRELFGRMMRSAEFDPYILTAIHKLRASGRFRIVALTNNYSAQYDRIRSMNETTAKALFDPEAELEFLGWGADTGGPGGPRIRQLFDDFVDSSVVGSRKPEPGIYEYACRANNVKPSEVVFLDDLGLNLRTAKKLGMKTIHVPIGESRRAVAELQELVKIPLLDSSECESTRRKSKL
ncbi:haloacid dehalogenase [Ceratobasidium sp. AG-Ba]|nr:haloacid dehalogenase [Ceratobasidium sp. AG-Ba]